MIMDNHAHLNISADLGLVAQQANAASSLLKAISHENRLLILCILCGGEKTVTELEHLLALRQPNVSQQLARLRSENLVIKRRAGKVVYYRLADDEIRNVIDALSRMLRH